MRRSSTPIWRGAGSAAGRGAVRRRARRDDRPDRLLRRSAAGPGNAGDRDGDIAALALMIAPTRHRPGGGDRHAAKRLDHFGADVEQLHLGFVRISDEAGFEHVGLPAISVRAAETSPPVQLSATATLRPAARVRLDHPPGEIDQRQRQGIVFGIAHLGQIIGLLACRRVMATPAYSRTMNLARDLNSEDWRSRRNDNRPADDSRSGRSAVRTVATAWAAIPSPRPVKPSRSVVVALTLTDRREGAADRRSAAAWRRGADRCAAPRRSMVAVDMDDAAAARPTRSRRIRGTEEGAPRPLADRSAGNGHRCRPRRSRRAGRR